MIGTYPDVKKGAGEQACHYPHPKDDLGGVTHGAPRAGLHWVDDHSVPVTQGKHAGQLSGVF